MIPVLKLTKFSKSIWRLQWLISFDSRKPLDLSYRKRKMGIKKIPHEQKTCHGVVHHQTGNDFLKLFILSYMDRQRQKPLIVGNLLRKSYTFQRRCSPRQESPPHERCSTPSCVPGESSCNNEKQTNLFRSVSFIWRSAVTSRETLSNGTNWSASGCCKDDVH